MIFLFFSFFISKAIASLSFQTALQMILERNQDIQSTEALFQATQKGNLPLRLYCLPDVSFMASKPLLGASSALAGMGARAFLDIKWNFFNFGADTYRLKSAKDLESAAFENKNTAFLTAQIDAVQVLIRFIQTAMVLNIHKKMLKNQKYILEHAQKRYQKGYLAYQEVQKITVDLSNTDARLQDAYIHFTEAQTSLEAALGQSDLDIEWPWPFLTQTSIENTTEGPFYLLSRPEILSQLALIQSIDHRITHEKLSMLPSLSLNYTWGYQSGFWGTNIGGAFIFNIKVPLFDRFIHLSEASRQFFLKQSSQALLEKSRRNLTAEWSRSVKNFYFSQKTVLSRNQNLALSRSLFEDNLKRFEAGKISVNDLSVDRTRLYQAELNGIEGWSILHRSFATWCQSRGKHLQACLESTH